MRFSNSTGLGGRPSQQDTHLIVENLFGNPEYCLFGIFDGHGSEGRKASDFAKVTFPVVISELAEQFLTDPVAALKTSFAMVNSKMIENPALDAYMSGTTCSIAFCSKDTIVVANVGDSRVVLGQVHDGNWSAVQLSIDHTCANKQELDRVVSCGARVEQLQVGDAKEGPLRIFKGTLPYPGIVVTRTLGDSVASKLGVLCEPDTVVHTISPDDSFLILASDGVWDGLTTAEVVDIVRANLEDPAKASRLLTKKSITGMKKRQMDDNSTNIVVFFK